MGHAFLLLTFFFIFEPYIAVLGIIGPLLVVFQGPRGSHTPKLALEPFEPTP